MSKAGMKDDDGRAQIETMVFSYFPRALAAVSTVSEYGARKYTRMGWLTVPDGVDRYTDALARHQLKQYTEGTYDETDSGLSHAAQMAWNALARLELMLAQGKVEDRIGNDIKDGKPVLGTAHARVAPSPAQETFQPGAVAFDGLGNPLPPVFPLGCRRDPNGKGIHCSCPIGHCKHRKFDLTAAS